MCKTYSKEWIFLKEKKKLNIKGTVLDRYQLEQYLEKIASDHILTEKSAKDTYPIPRLKENFFVIKEIYKLLNEQIKQGIPIHPAGEWILDNLYVIEEIVKNISKELTLKKYTDFLGLANGRFKGFARVYVLATEMVAYTDGKINSENTVLFNCRPFVCLIIIWIIDVLKLFYIVGEQLVQPHFIHIDPPE